MTANRHALDFDTPTVAALRADLALALRAAAHHGLAEGVCNHFSVELPDGSGRFLLNPRGRLWQEVQAGDVVLVDAAGTVLAGRHPVEPTAMFIHAAIHRIARQPCVLHTHMPHATALTLISDRALDPTLSQTAMRFHGRVAVDRHYNGLALDEAEGDRIAAALGNADIVFMKHHGVLVLGATIAETWDDLYYLERACEVQRLAMSTGRPVIPVPEDVARRTYEQMRAGDRESARLHLESVKRELRRTEPGFEA